MKFGKIDKELITDLIKSGDRGIILLCDYLKEIRKGTDSRKNLGEVCLDLALKGNVKAMHAISILLSYGLMCKQNKKKALYWCSRSVNEKHYPSFITLSDFYTHGWGGIKINYTKLFDLIEKAALKNFAPAITMMGLCNPPEKK